MIALVLSLFQAVPVNPFALVAMLKPAVIDGADAPLVKLRKEDYNARLAAIEKTVNEPVRINVWDDRPPQWWRLFNQVGPFTEAAVALESTPAGRAKWHEWRIAALRDTERLAAGYIEAGRERPQSIHLVRAARIEAQIDLLTSFPTTDGQLLNLKEIPTRLDPKADRDPPELALPKLIADAIKPDKKDTALRKLHKARVRERAIYVVKTKAVFAIGQFEGIHLPEFRTTQMRLGDNLADVMDQPADKIKAFESRRDNLREFEKLTAGLVSAGRLRPQAENVARAARLGAEIELLRLRVAHKLATNEQPDVKYADPKLLALWKLPPFVLDAIKPNEKDTPLRKLLKARAGDCLVASEKQREVVGVGRWDADVFADAMHYPALLAESLADLMDAPADRINVFEMRLERMKELEKVVAEKVENGHSWPNDGYFAKVARIEAEVALQKVKDAAKAGK